MSNVRRFGMLLALLVTTALPAQSRDQRSAAVGMRAYVEQLVLPGSELEPAPGDMKSPVVVRVLKVWPHGNQLRYDLEWTGLEAGEYDLAKFLRRKDGAASDDLPKVAVVVTRTLPKQQMEPSEPAPSPAPRLDGYSRLQGIAGIAWAVGLLLILFVGRRRRRAAVAPPPPKPTLADRLRPLVEAVAGDRANSAAKAELERLLLAFWRARLDLQQQKAADAILTIKRHPEAGALLRQIEAWLHMPAPPARVDLSGLLAPYRTVTADDFAPLPAPGQTTAGKA
ncbi:MAG: hypothetical protein JNN13_19140 [Planctomycetes bacterium]|nr:hypothetical protein [Planctomycetota bacterium]